MEVRKAVVVTLETINTALTFLKRCPYEDVSHFLGQLVAEANATLHDIQEFKKTAEEIVSAVEEV